MLYSLPHSNLVNGRTKLTPNNSTPILSLHPPVRHNNELRIVRVTGYAPDVLSGKYGTLFPAEPIITCPDTNAVVNSQRSPADWLFSLEDEDSVPEYLTRSVFGYCDGFHKRYLLGSVLGTGSWGVVREATDLLTMGNYAVKIIKKSHPKTAQFTVGYLRRICNEVQLLGDMRGCPRIAQLYQVFEDQSSVYLVMQQCQGGSLNERAKERLRTEQQVAKHVREVLEFVAECHSREIIYRDIKPTNFLYLTNESDSPLVAVDMGLAVRHYTDDPNLTSRTGTPAYMAPELINKNYSYNADVWSVGCLTYQLLFGELPWKTTATRAVDVLQSILDTKINFASLYEKVSYEAVDFLSNVLVKNPKLRFDAQQALQHPWLSNVSKKENKSLNSTVSVQSGYR